MIVKELIALLLNENPNRIIIIQKDSEGNSFSPLSDIYIGKYQPYNTWSGKVGLANLTFADMEQGYTIEDVLVNGELAIILTPIN